MNEPEKPAREPDCVVRLRKTIEKWDEVESYKGPAAQLFKSRLVDILAHIDSLTARVRELSESNVALAASNRNFHWREERDRLTKENAALRDAIETFVCPMCNGKGSLPDLEINGGRHRCKVCASLIQAIDAAFSPQTAQPRPGGGKK